MTNDLAALSEAYTKSPNALSLTLLGHALVDEYRAGRLKPVNPEGMRERVAGAMRYWTNGDFDIQGFIWVRGPDGYKKSFADADDAYEHAKAMNADAAIAAILGDAA